MYLLDAEDAQVPALREALAPLGDSLVVVGGAGLWNVHVHVNDIGAAIEAGIAAGRPHRIVVTRFADQDVSATQPHAPRSRRAVVTTSAGPGLTELFGRAGARVVASEPGRRARTGDFVEAVLGTGAREVVVLPNDARLVAAAEAAARQVRDSGIRAAVIPTRAQVQGLAALAVHDPDRSFDDDVVHMSSAAGQTRHAAVTVARERAMTTVGPCEPGDVLGVVDGDFAVVGQALNLVATQVVDRLLGGAGELLTVLSGADAGPELAAELADHVSRTRPEVDVVVHEGGQRGYQLLLAVE
jgi:dihydroxyacetone kinase-like predicted kinase